VYKAVLTVFMLYDYDKNIDIILNYPMIFITTYTDVLINDMIWSLYKIPFS